MTYQYWPLKFPDEATSLPLLADIINVDVIGLITGATGWHVNIALSEPVPTDLQPYVIPFPLYPKRVWFTNEDGVV